MPFQIHMGGNGVAVKGWEHVGKRCQVVSVPASAFPLTLLALMGFRDPIDGQLQVQTEEVQWGVRKLRRNGGNSGGELN